MTKKTRDISVIMNSITWAQKITDRNLPLLDPDDPGADDRKWMRDSAFKITLKELLTGQYTMKPDEFEL